MPRNVIQLERSGLSRTWPRISAFRCRRSTSGDVRASGRPPKSAGDTFGTTRLPFAPGS